jgi:hypothetical protein
MMHARPSAALYLLQRISAVVLADTSLLPHPRCKSDWLAPDNTTQRCPLLKKYMSDHLLRARKPRYTNSPLRSQHTPPRVAHDFTMSFRVGGDVSLARTSSLPKLYRPPKTPTLLHHQYRRADETQTSLPSSPLESQAPQQDHSSLVTDLNSLAIAQVHSDDEIDALMEHILKWLNPDLMPSADEFVEMASRQRARAVEETLLATKTKQQQELRQQEVSDIATFRSKYKLPHPQNDSTSVAARFKQVGLTFHGIWVPS